MTSTLYAAWADPGFQDQVYLGAPRTFELAASEGLQRWHHTFGPIIAPFILCWIFSGFLSACDGGLFGFVGGSVNLFQTLHTFDFPPMASRPWLRTSMIVGLCLCGLAVSLTGVMLAWRRLRWSSARPKASG